MSDSLRSPRAHCSPPGSSVLSELLQARALEWVAISFSRGIFSTQESNLRLLNYRQMLYYLSPQGRLKPRLDLQRETSLGYLRKGFELDQKADTGRVEKGAEMLKGSSPWRMKFHSVLQELSSHWMLVNLWQIVLYNETWFWSKSPPLHKNDILWFVLLIFHPFRFCMTEKVDSVK